MTTRNGNRAPGASGGFTLVEMLIAVGAVALVGVALGAVFEMTGRTIRAGRQVSAFTSYASLIERQLRRDIDAMTRDGYLIIRNEMADADQTSGFSASGDAVARHPDDRSPRPRRIDELMFFATGEFRTARSPLGAGFIASADAARVYYGHGKRRIVNANDPSAYTRPLLNDQNNEANANLGVNYALNPNRYAGDWTLLRHATLLCPPRASTEYKAYPNYAGVTVQMMLDRDQQIALQPAASSIFRGLAAIFPDAGQTPQSFPAPPAIRTDFNLRPQFSGGIVDIATTTLAEIRAIVVTADRFPNQATNQFFNPAANAGPDGSNIGVDGKHRRYAPSGQPNFDTQLLGRSQSWMEDGLPAWSHASSPNDRVRVRYEPAPPNYLGVLRDGSPPLVEAIERADQLMLSASNFLPHCTEFIVEWSFGRTYPSFDGGSNGYVAGREGELIWHGMARLADGTPTTNTNINAVATPYNHNQVLEGFDARYRRLDGAISNYRVLTEVVHGQGLGAAYAPAVGETVTSYFGYIDPSFNPDQDPPGGDGRVESPGDAATPTIPWAWPKLIRVTLGLADPNDPSVEQRFQFVMEVPERREP